MGLQPLEQLLVVLAVGGRDRELVELVVVVAQAGVAVHPLGLGRVAQLAQAARALVLARLGARLLDLGVARVELELADAGDREVDVVGGEEPAAEEPVQVLARGVLHRAEEVARVGPLEGPAAAVFAEGEVEGLAPEHGLAQDGQGQGDLAVGVVAALSQEAGVGHDRLVAAGLHVVEDPLAAGRVARGVFLLPVALGDLLDEGVEALVHPAPAPLVVVDDHREPVVPDLVNDHADQAVLAPLGVGPVRLGARPLERDHGVLHPAHAAVAAQRDGVGVFEVAPVALEGVRHGVGGVLAPQGLGLVGVVAHGHHGPLADGDAHGVPGVLARGGPGEVAHVLGVELPGPPPLGPALGGRLLGGLGLGGGDHEHGLLGRARLGQPRALGGAEHLGGVLQLAGRGHDHVHRRVEADHEVAELERELLAHVVVDVPAVALRVGGQARIPVGDRVDRVLGVLLEQLVAGAGAVDADIADRVAPGDREGEAPAGLERLGQVDAQHRAADRVAQRLGRLAGGRDGADLIAAGEALAEHLVAQLAVALLVLLADRVGGADPQQLAVLGLGVLVELDPEVAQHVGRVVAVVDPLAARDSVLLLVEGGLDPVVDLLLPVAVAWRPRGGAGRPWGRELAVELAEERVAVGALLGAGGAAQAEEEQQQEGARESGAHGVASRGRAV